MSDQLLYKYRGLDPWEYFLDIIVNNRLHAAKFTALNDPMEGVFTYSEDSASPSFVKQMIDHKQQFGICSLSESFNNTLMWSYYASAHQGVVIGLKLPEQSPGVISTDRVNYAADNFFRGFLGSDAETEARKVLSKKLSAWRHEKEVRVFSRSNFVTVEIQRIYLGCLMPEARKDLVKKLVVAIKPNIQVLELNTQDLDVAVSEYAI